MPRSRAWRARRRKGQSEVIGGLIVLTLLFLFAVPLILNLYQSTIRTGQEARQAVEAQRFYLNEKIIVQAVDPNSVIAQRAGWIPGVWINNTGTVAVTLDKLYLIDQANDTIYVILDLSTARPGVSDLVKDLVVDPLQPTSYTPPYGEPITLQPGQSLLVVFNQTILPLAPNLLVLVESASGVLHPIGGGGQAPTLFPGRPQTGVQQGLWRGIFAPQSGFDLPDGEALLNRGEAWAWKPPIRVYTCDQYGRPAAVGYEDSFIYDDSDYPGLYKIYLTVDYSWSSDYRLCYDGRSTNIEGDEVVIKGYLGTYDPGRGTYISGYAFEIYINGQQVAADDSPIILPSDSIEVTDFDGNGIPELTFFDFLNGPNYDVIYNIDADDDGSEVSDTLAWTYMVSRDISGVDFIRVTIKSNYYWTTTFSGACPSWDTRDLRIFSIVVYEYQDDGTWKIYQFKDFMYTTTKPKQYQETAVFPVNNTKTYRVGVIFYDNYRDWYGFGYNCWTDFTYTIEHMIVEYGVYNPLFQESPPLYIVAIPDPDLIDGIGIPDYMNAYNITDEDVAKVRAQADLLKTIEEELKFAGVAGYTVIDDPTTLCQLLFGVNPPKYAIVYWLQGNVTFSDVLDEAGCALTERDVAEYAAEYRWVIVFPFGEPFGDRYLNVVYDVRSRVLGPGEYNGTITEYGVKIRKEAYAFYLFNDLPFQYVVDTTHPIWNATLYIYNDTTTNTIYQATTGFWLELDGDLEPEPGVVVVNPVHIDWDVTGDGVIPQTLAQQVVYSSLIAWTILLTST